jgi:hypothetical protein
MQAEIGQLALENDFLAVAAVDGREIDIRNACSRLRGASFDATTATRLATSHSLVEIERQIGWMKQRNAIRNYLGMLRKAIEEDWPAPSNTLLDVQGQFGPATRFARHFYAGLANNKATSVAPPSPADLAAGLPLLDALA